MKAATELGRWRKLGPGRGTSERLRVLGPEIQPQYRLVPIEAGRHPFLNSLFEAFDSRTLQVWIDADGTTAGFDRSGCDGLVTAIGEWDGQEVAVAWSDFRVNGAAYGRANSRRFCTFLRHLRQCRPGAPLVYVVNSSGVSIMEGRSAFSSAFAIWPELLAYSEENPVLTCATNKCLGLAPLLFGLGHYRVAVAGSTQVNLTGPDVIRMFFGKDLDFAGRGAAERSLEHHDLVHEVVPSTEAALRLFRDLVLGARGEPAQASAPELGPQTGPLLDSILDHPPVELVPGWCPRVRLFLGTRRGQPLGVFINPPERSDNLINVRTLDKYASGLDLFRALKVPILSLLDSPGLDPRFEQSDAGNIRRILAVGERIIRYPYGSMGVVVGRCFGGATTLAFPGVFGGKRALVLRGARVGVMDDRIIERLLGASPRLLGQWQQSVARRGPAFQDLLEEGTVDAVIEPAELAGEIDGFLDSEGGELLGSRPPQLPVRLQPPPARALKEVG